MDWLSDFSGVLGMAAGGPAGGAVGSALGSLTGGSTPETSSATSSTGQSTFTSGAMGTPGTSSWLWIAGAGLLAFLIYTRRR